MAQVSPLLSKLLRVTQLVTQSNPTQAQSIADGVGPAGDGFEKDMIVCH